MRNVENNEGLEFDNESWEEMDGSLKKYENPENNHRIDNNHEFNENFESEATNYTEISNFNFTNTKAKYGKLFFVATHVIN